MAVSRRQIVLGGSGALGAALLAACSAPQEGAPSSSSSGATGSAAASPTDTPAPASTLPPAGEPVAWKDVSRVPHLFFHSLAVDAERAFSASGDKADGYLNFMVTVDEFTAMLEQIHAKGYVLVSPHELYEVGEDDVVRPRTLMVPENRTPLVLSVDDVSYYLYMEGDGFADRLVIDGDGRVRTQYTDAEGTVHVGAHDVMPLVDDFVAAHPDFSLNGAKGVLAMTGYDGVFGYRTSKRQFGDSPTFEADVAEAKRVAQALKDTGWEFASHSWGHRNLGTLELEYIRKDSALWTAEVEPILGATDMYIYPFGSDVAGIEKYSSANAKYRHLRELGFRSFFLVDGTSKAWGQLQPGYYRGSRINVDGISMKAALDGVRPVLDEFFDTASVLDPARPASVAGSKKTGAGASSAPASSAPAPSAPASASPSR